LLYGGYFRFYIQYFNNPLGGFAAGASKDLAQTQAIMSMMQFSVAPWRVLGKKHLDILREAPLLNAKMGEYRLPIPPPLAL
jgi:alpha-glucosidase